MKQIRGMTMFQKLVVALLAMGVAGIFCCLCTQVATPAGTVKPLRPTPTETPEPSPTVTPVPEPTATPTKVLPTPTLMPTATPTPSPLVDTQDAAFVLALDNLMTYQGAVVVGLLEDIADASQRVDVIKLCQAADDLVTACLVFGAELEALPSPAHSYLTRSYACLEQAVTSFGAVGLAIQDFCDTGDTLKLYSAIEGMNQGTEQLTCSTEWLDKYRGEIQ